MRRRAFALGAARHLAGRWLIAAGTACALWSVTAESWAARCGHQIIAPGDHQFEVLQRCGEPDFAATRLVYPFRRLGPGAIGVTVSALDGADGPANRPANRVADRVVDRPGDRDARAAGVVQILDFPTLIDEWIYAGAAGRFSQLLRFSNGRLIEVELLDKPSR